MSRIIRPTATESRIYGGLATVYHRTRREDIAWKIGSDGFLRGSRGTYGRGVYSTYTLKSQQTDKMYQVYGPFIIKAVVKLPGFLILDKKAIRKVYGSDISITDQIFDKITDTKTRLDVDKVLDSAKDEGAFTSDIAVRLHRSVKGLDKYFPGMLFTGRHDGQVVVIYNQKEITPISYCYSDDDYFNRSEDEIDWTKINSYKNLGTSLRAVFSRMNPGSRFSRHTRKDPDWDGAISWIDGLWEDGIWDRGVWLQGTWLDGDWKTGVWHDGVWRDGVWRSGEWHGGTWEDGTWRSGHWYGGTWLSGNWMGGTWHGGYDHNGVFHDKDPNHWAYGDLLSKTRLGRT